MLYFGVLRDRLAGSQEWLELIEGAIVADVLNVYRERLYRFCVGLDCCGGEPGVRAGR